jgi:transcriptional regulator with XRE-family HTH domain
MEDVKRGQENRRSRGGTAEVASDSGPEANAGRSQAVRLGARIRAVRKERGLTLDVLGRLAGVTRSFLSQVENDISAPSIETLRKIAQALGTPVFALVDDHRDHRKVVRKQDRKRIRGPHSPVEYELLSPDLQRNMEVIMMELEPGQASSPVPIGHRGEECATILSGKARVQVGDEYFDLEEGDTIYFDSGVPHRVLNPGTTPMRLISTITPPSF